MPVARLRTDTPERLRFQQRRRVDLDLDLLRGTYRLTRGGWPHLVVHEGPIRDDLVAVRLRKSRNAVWSVAIEVKANGRPVVVFESLSDRAARREWTRWAVRLHLDAVDVTKRKPVTISARSLTDVDNHRLGPEIDGADDLDIPPLGLTVQHIPGGFAADLPAPGLSVLTVALLLIGTVGAVMGGLAVLAGAGPLHGPLLLLRESTGSGFAPAVAGWAMALAGFSVIVASLGAARSRRRVAYFDGVVQLGIALGDWMPRSQAIAIDDLHQVKVLEGGGRRTVSVQKDNDEVGRVRRRRHGTPAFAKQRALVLNTTATTVAFGHGHREDHLEWIAITLRRHMPGTTTARRLADSRQRTLNIVTSN